MRAKPWRLPWQGKMVPHAVIDILRGCNISCRACYNTTDETRPKSLDRIEQEVDRLLELRRLSSVTILGGEVLLHPGLCDIVRLLRRKGLKTELITNGLAANAEVLRDLSHAGLNVVYFHIERGQKRDDLPKEHSANDLNNLRSEKIRLASEQRLDVGLTMTVYPDEYDDMQSIVDLTLRTPAVSYLLLTLFRDSSAITSLRGNIYDGMYGQGKPLPHSAHQGNRAMDRWMMQRYGFDPFAFVGSCFDRDDPRWLSYLIGVAYGPDGQYHASHLRVSLLEKSMMLLFRVLARRYPMYLEQNSSLFRKQLVLNGLLGGRRQANHQLLEEARRPGAQLKTKRILFQEGAELMADGRLLHCEWCPDAVLKNDSLVPVCIADHVS